MNKVLWKLIILIVIFYLNNCSVPKIFETILDSKVIHFYNCKSVNEKTQILAFTESGMLYRSEDQGKIWITLNAVKTNNKSGKKSKIRKVIQSEIFPGNFFLIGYKKVSWIIRDCGENIEELELKRKIYDFKFHNTEKNYAILSCSSFCKKEKSDDCDNYRELFLTVDFKKFSSISKYVYDFSWGVNSIEDIEKGIPKERIFLTYEPRGKGHQSTGWTYKLDFIYSDNFFKDHKVLIFKGNRFLIRNDLIFVSQLVDQEQKQTKLWVSKISTNNFEFEEVDIGKVELKEHDYFFLEFNTETIFLNVNHFHENSLLGHLYKSDSEGIQFTSTLLYNIRDTEGNCEFQKVQSLEGVFLANTVDSEIVEKFHEQLLIDINAEQTSMNDSGDKIINKQIKNIRDHVETQITYNNGGEWHRLIAPKVDSDGKEYDCGDYCYLNLHLTSLYYPDLYSSKDSIGLLIGNGNVGQYLSLSESELSTFLSIDGGLTWIEIKKSPHLTFSLNHGSLLVLSEINKHVNSLSFSWNHGITFSNFHLEKNFKINEISYLENSLSLKLILSADTTIKGESKSNILTIDFSSLDVQVCKNIENPNYLNSDYETWYLNYNHHNDGCNLGVKYVYVRRKRDSVCFNPVDHEKKTFLETCLCTEFDFECDYGYERSSPNEPCRLVDEALMSSFPKNCEGYYNVSSGYKKIPGNKCIGGVQKINIPVPCHKGFINVLIGIVMGIFFFGLLFIAWSSYKSINESKNRVKGSDEYGYVKKKNGKNERIRESQNIEMNNFIKLDKLE